MFKTFCSSLEDGMIPFHIISHCRLLTAQIINTKIPISIQSHDTNNIQTILEVYCHGKMHTPLSNQLLDRKDYSCVVLAMTNQTCPEKHNFIRTLTRSMKHCNPPSIGFCTRISINQNCNLKL